MLVCVCCLCIIHILHYIMPFINRVWYIVIYIVCCVTHVAPDRGALLVSQTAVTDRDQSHSTLLTVAHIHSDLTRGQLHRYIELLFDKLAQ